MSVHPLTQEAEIPSSKVSASHLTTPFPRTIALVGVIPETLLLVQKIVLKGSKVIIQDFDKKNLEKAVLGIGRHVDEVIGSGGIEEGVRDAVMGRIQLTMDLPPLQTADSIIVSCPPGDLKLANNLVKLDQSIPPEIPLMMNITSASVTSVARDLIRPGRFLGIHFLTPNDDTLAVEIVRGVKTDNQTLRTVGDLFEYLGISWVVAHDFPGFIVNRLVAPLINEAVFALYEGVGTAEEVDRAYQLGTGQTIGPLALADRLGLDTVLEILRGMHRDLGNSRYAPCPLLVKYVEAGFLGKKSGKGFFEYN